VSTTPRNVLPPGHLIQWYEITEVLGHGGFGITYLATDTNLKQNVAIKEFFPAEFVYRGAANKVVTNSEESNEVIQWARARFLEEGQTLAQFDHPGIVRVIAVFEANDTAYLVMRYENGEPLSNQIPRRKQLAEELIWPLIDPLLDGLELVHQAGFIHRDIKPGNIFIREDGSPVLLDFGSARKAMGEATRTLTTLVSPGFAPIEQYQQEGATQGPWTDIYGMAATLYRCAFGASPADAVQRSQSMLERGVDSLVLPTDLAGGSYSPRFCDFVSLGLALNPSDRPRSIAEWRSSDADRSFAPTVRLPNDNDTDTAAIGNTVSPTVALPAETQSTIETKMPDIDGLPPDEKDAITENIELGARRFGSNTAAKISLVGIFVLIGLAAWWWVGIVPESPPVPESALVPVPVPAPIRSIAVLPLQNLSDDPEQAYFADGVTEDLIGALAGIKALRVPSHRSVLRFKGTTESLPQIAAELEVDALIEGTVRRVGNQVRITVQLVKGSDEHIWHQTYDEDLREILALQARIARAVADRVKVTLTAGETDRLTTERSVVPAAYDAYVRARQLQRSRFGASAVEIVELLERAVALDPEFVSAHVWLAQAYWAVAIYNFAPSKVQAPKARAEAEKAVALGGVEANLTLGNLAAYYDWDNAKAVALYQSVRDARPNTAFSADAWGLKGMVLCVLGEWETGLNQMREGNDADPLYFAQRGWTLSYEARSRRYDSAIAGSKALLAIEPNVPNAYLALYQAHWWKGEIDEFVAVNASYVKQLGMDPAPFLAAYSNGGIRAYMRTWIAFWQDWWSRTGAGAVWVAQFYAYLGEADLAFEWLERGYDERDSHLSSVFNTNPAFDPIRDDPRFAALAERVEIRIVEPDGPLVTPPADSFDPE
jgi:serine/threonine protein kinase/TolB-like protein